MDDLGAAIRARRLALGLSLEALSARAGCAKSYLSTIENGRRAHPPSEEVVRRIAAALETEPERLLRLARWQATPALIREEVGQMQAQNHLAGRLVSLLRQNGLDSAHASGELRRLVDSLDPDRRGGGNIEPGPPVRRIPLINNVAAGYPREFTDLGYPARVADEYVAAPGIADEDAFAARVVGDSMAPEYHEGDIVIFSPERDTPPGSDCFVRFEDDAETMFKRIFFERGGAGEERIRLQPLNNRYPPRVEDRERIAGMYAAAYVVRAVAGGA